MQNFLTTLVFSACGLNDHFFILEVNDFKKPLNLRAYLKYNYRN